MTIYETVIDVLRHYRQYEVADENGDGYPLIDALTLEGHGIDMGIREIENIADAIAEALRREREPVEPVVWMQRHRLGPLHISGPEAVASDDWSAPFPVYATPPDALALVAAAYRDAADWLLDMRAVDDDGNETTPEADVYVTLINGLPKRTPADAAAALTAIERAAYERGVRDALAAADKEAKGKVHIGGQAFRTVKLDDLEPAALALLTQEGR